MVGNEARREHCAQAVVDQGGRISQGFILGAEWKPLRLWGGHIFIDFSDADSGNEY